MNKFLLILFLFCTFTIVASAQETLTKWGRNWLLGKWPRLNYLLKNTIE